MGKKQQPKHITEMNHSKNPRNIGVRKRRAGLMKKARELAVLSDSEIAVIIFTNKGELIEYSSTSNILGTLSRYSECEEIYRQRKEQEEQAQITSRVINKREMRIEEKQELIQRLQEMPPEVAAPVFHILRRQNPDLTLEGDELEIDIDSLDLETLWELDRCVANNKNVSETRELEQIDRCVANNKNVSETREQEQIENPISDLMKKAAKKTEEVNIFKKKITELLSKHSKLMDGDLSDVGLKEVLQLEQELTSVLHSIQDRKGQILLGQLEKSTTKKEELMLVKENLTKQVEELKSSFELSKSTQPLCIEYLPQSPVVDSNAKDDTERRGTICSVDNEPRPNLDFGSTTLIPREMKMPEEQTCSNFP